jgi:hypothetical protein
MSNHIKEKELPKSVRVELVDKASSAYKVLRRVRTKYHQHLRKARIALAWLLKVKVDRDGHILLGRCMRASDLQRELAEYDFIILLNKDVWRNSEFGKKEKYALMDHELCHAEVVYNKKGKLKKDIKGRYCYRTKKHDVEEFRSVIEHHGIWKHDLELFAEALLKKRKRDRGGQHG